MTPLRPRPPSVRLGAGAAAGALAGVALVAAEVAASLVLGAALPPRAWEFQALHWVPSFALVGALLALRLPVPAVAAALVWLPAAAYGAAVAGQDLLSGQPRLAPSRLAALFVSAAAMAVAAWTVERAFLRRPLGPLPALLVRAALSLPVVLVLQHSARTLRGASVPAALIPPVAAAAAAVVTAMVLAPVAARLSVRAVAMLAVGAAFALGAAAAWQAGRPAPGSLRDDPQPAAPADGATRGPSVVLIVLDTVRASSLSCYGYERATTPHLDAFAASGVRFTEATTASPWSVPSHASLFTGLFAPEHGAGAGERDPRTGKARPAPLDPRFVTLAEGLAGRGYATAGISANVLLAEHNLAKGFRHWDARRSPRALSPRYRSLLQRVQGLLPHALLADRLLEEFPGVFRPAEEITDAGLAWLGRRPAGQPYFLFLNYMDAHTPFVRHPGWSGRWPGRSPRLPAYGLRDVASAMAGQRAFTPEERDHIRALYDDALSYLDHHLARLLAGLDAQPDRDHTWIIITADHGEALGEHGRLGHDCVLTQQVLHVPLIVRYPRGAAEAARHGPVDDAPVPLTDLAPAILAAAGAAPPPSSRRARAASVDCYCWSAHPQFHGPSGRVLFEGGLKYVDEEGRPPALYDLVADPAESRNVAEERAEDVLRLSRALDGWRAGLAPAPAPRSLPPDPAQEEALRALGYAQ